MAPMIKQNDSNQLNPPSSADTSVADALRLKIPPRYYHGRDVKYKIPVNIRLEPIDGPDALLAQIPQSRQLDVFLDLCQRTRTFQGTTPLSLSPSSNLTKISRISQTRLNQPQLVFKSTKKLKEATLRKTFKIDYQNRMS